MRRTHRSFRRPGQIISTWNRGRIAHTEHGGSVWQAALLIIASIFLNVANADANAHGDYTTAQATRGAAVYHCKARTVGERLRHCTISSVVRCLRTHLGA